MTGRDFAFVGCRLLALCWAVMATYQVSSFAFAWSTLRDKADIQDGMELAAYFYFMPLVLYVLVALVLWFAAPWLARHVAPKTSPEGEDRSVMRVDVQAIAFAAVGLLVLMGALPELGVAIYQYSRLEDLDGRFETAFGAPAKVAELTIQMALGLLLVFGARGLSGLLIRVRTAGVK